MNAPLRVAVVTGGHPYDVPGLTAMFRELPGIDAYFQHMEDFVTDTAGRRGWYDVALFYTMLQETPTGEGPWFMEKAKSALEFLGETPQGIFLLHHSILAYPQWPFWRGLTGIAECAFHAYHLGETVRVNVAESGHPITQGLRSWEMIDETYEMNEPDSDSTVLLTLDHPRSMRAAAWTRLFRNARVFCFQCGHDNTAYAHPHFRTVVARGLEWCAGRL